MQEPYGFLDFKAQRETGIGMTFDSIDQEQAEKVKFKKKYKRFHDFEKKVVDQYVDVYANKAVRKLGYRRANWLPLVQVLITIMCILNVFACIARPDFLTGLVCVLAIFYLSDNEEINRDKFRLLPLLQLFSIIYDFIWLFFVQNMVEEGEKTEKGLERSVKAFSV